MVRKLPIKKQNLIELFDEKTQTDEEIMSLQFICNTLCDKVLYVSVRMCGDNCTYNACDV